MQLLTKINVHRLSLNVSVAKGCTAKGKKTPGKAMKGPKEDVVEKILCFLYENHEVGTTSVPEEQVVLVSGYARADSTGYRKAANQIIKIDELAERSSKCWSLTEKGIKVLETKAGPKIKPFSNHEMEVFIKQRILKMSQKKVPEEKLNSVWNVLRDGKVHSREELLLAAGYKRPDSTGYREIMKWMKKLELVETTGTSFKFIAEKVAPFDE